MKKSIFLLLILSVSVGCKKSTADVFATTEDGAVGRIVDDRYVVNPTVADSLLGTWDEILADNKITTKIKEFRIIKETDVVTKDSRFGLLAVTHSDSAKAVCDVRLKGDTFYFNEGPVRNVVICAGSIECTPKPKNGQWVCYDETGTEKCSNDCVRLSVSAVDIK